MAYLSPGVEPTLVDYSTYVGSVSSTITGIVGGFTKGPLYEPVAVSDPNDFVRKFGNPSPEDHAGLAAMMFLKRGDSLWVVRVAEDPAKATVSFAGLAGGATVIPGVLVLTMKENGTFGNGYSGKIENVNQDLFDLVILDSTNREVLRQNASLLASSDVYIGNMKFDLFDQVVKDTGEIPSSTAGISFGAGTNGVVQIQADTAGAAGNELSLTIVRPSAAGAQLGATLAGNDITLSLATDGEPAKAAEARIGVGDNGVVLLRAVNVGTEGNDLQFSVINASTAGSAPSARLVNSTHVELTLGTATPGVKAEAHLENGADGTIDLEVDDAGVEGNSYTIEVSTAQQGTNDQAPDVEVTGTDIVVKLATDDTGAISATANTATLVAAAINSALSGIITATAQGTGATNFSSAIPKVNFTGGVAEVSAATKNTAILLAEVMNGVTNKFYNAQFSGDGTDPVTQVYPVTNFTGGTDGESAEAENTAIAIAGAINGILGKTFTANYSGNGTGTIDEVLPKTNFTGGSDGGVVTQMQATPNPQPFTGGLDGMPTTIDNVLQGLEEFTNPDTLDINVLICPGRWEYPIVAKMLGVCKDRHDCIAIVDPPQGLSYTDAIKYHNGTLEGENNPIVKLDTFFGAMYYPWVLLTNPTNYEVEWAPPSGVIAGMYAYNDKVAELWNAPAGLTRGTLPDVNDVEVILTKSMCDDLYGRGNAINPILNYKGLGYVAWGQRSLQRDTTALDRINVVRLMLYVMKSITISSAYLVFEQNDETTWTQWKGMVRPFLERIKVARGITEYQIVMDATTVTPDHQDRGEMPGYVRIKPTKAAEFIPIDFVLTAQGADFGDGE